MGADIEITRCAFEGNNATSAGGGLYITLSGLNNSHTITIRECNFTDNSAYIGAGMVTFYNPITKLESLSSELELAVNRVTIENCIFVGNSGRFGGALSNIQLGNLNALNITNSTFVENKGSLGAALYLQYFFTTFSFEPERKIVIEDW